MVSSPGCNPLSMAVSPLKPRLRTTWLTRPSKSSPRVAGLGPRRSLRYWAFGPGAESQSWGCDASHRDRRRSRAVFAGNRCVLPPSGVRFGLLRFCLAFFCWVLPREKHTEPPCFFSFHFLWGSCRGKSKQNHHFFVRKANTQRHEL